MMINHPPKLMLAQRVSIWQIALLAASYFASGVVAGGLLVVSEYREQARVKIGVQASGTVATCTERKSEPVVGASAVYRGYTYEEQRALDNLMTSLSMQPPAPYIKGTNR